MVSTPKKLRTSRSNSGVISSSLLKVGASFTFSFGWETSISSRFSLTRTISIGIKVDFIPNKPIFTPMYSGRSLSSTNRSSTLPIFS